MEAQDWAAGEAPVAPVLGRQGVVLASQPLAAAAGLQMLAAGGNAVDAVIAATWVEMVTLPMATGLGGDVLAMVWHPDHDAPLVLLGLGGAPLAADAAAARRRGLTRLPEEGPWAASWPAAVDALEQLRERYGRLARMQLLAPAIRYAADGFPLTRRAVRLIAAADLPARGNPACIAAYLAQGSPRVGDCLRQPDLARTLAEVADGGREAFYHGRFGENLMRWSAEVGAWFGPDDLAVRPARWAAAAPVTSSQRTWTTPAPSAGAVVAIARALWSALPPPASPALAITRLTRARAAGLALRGRPDWLAFAAAGGAPPPDDFPKWTGFVAVPAPPPPAGAWAAGTSLVSAVDAHGTQAMVMHSLSGLRFGSAWMVPGTGVVLNSRLARGSSLDPAAPNALAGGQVPDSTLTLWARELPGGLRLIGGSPGGDQQALWALAALAALDDNWPLADVVASPRWYDSGEESHLVTEARLPAAVQQELAAVGWTLRLLSPWGAAGGLQMVAWDREKPWGVGDPRIEGGQAAW